MVFLGLIYDTVNMTLEVLQDKLQHTAQLIRYWLGSPPVTKSDLPSLIGKAFLCLRLYQSWSNLHEAYPA